MYRDVGDQISKRKKTLNHGQKFLPKLFLIFFILHKDKFFFLCAVKFNACGVKFNQGVKKYFFWNSVRSKV